MKIIYNLVSIAIVGVFLSCSSPQNSGWSRHGLKGKVKTVFERNYEADQEGGKWVAEDLMAYGHLKKVFSEKGLPTNWEEYSASGSVLYKADSEYDAEGNFVQEKIYNYHEDGKEQTMKFVKNTADTIIYEIFTLDGKLAYKGETILKNNRFIKNTHSLYNNGIESEEKTIVVIEYDKDGNEKERSIKYYPYDNFNYGERYVYLEFDKKGNWTKRLIYNKENHTEPKSMAVREIEYYD